MSPLYQPFPSLTPSQATDVAREALTSAARDNGADDDKFRQDLMNIARTTLSSKLLTQHKEHFSHLAVDAVMRLRYESELYNSTVEGLR